MKGLNEMKYTYTKVKTKESIEWYKIKSGKKLYRVRFKRKINGKNIPYTKNGFKTIAEAVADRDHAISQITRSNGLNDNKITVKQYWELYRKIKVESHEWTLDTQHTTTNNFNKHILSHYADVPLSALERMEYQNYINYLLYKRPDPADPSKLKPLARSSVVTINRIFQALVNSAVADEKIDHNRIRKIKINKVDPPKKKALTVEEIGKVMLYFKTHVSKLRFAMLYLPILGLRRGEVMGIRYGSARLVEGGYMLTIDTSRTLRALAGKDPKTASSNRVLFVTGEPARQITIALHEFEQVVTKRNRIPHKDDFIFVSERTGKPLNPNVMSQEYAKCGDAIGLHPLHPHMLRHSVATLNSIKGIDTQLTAQFLGHSDTSMTDYYKEPTVLGKKVVMASINDAYNSINQELDKSVN